MPTKRPPLKPDIELPAQTLINVLGFVNDDDIRKLFGITESTLSAWNRRGTGPPSAFIGTVRFYPVDGLRDWIAARVRDRNRDNSRNFL